MRAPGRPARAPARAVDEGFMRRALALAERGRGATRPNPVVGAVVVRAGRVLGEGFHRRAGAPHAEVEALEAVARAGESARGATLYVNLEPCCHFGRTGPCTRAIVDAGLARVVVGVRDPNPRVDGRGLAALRRAGLRVEVGCLAGDAWEANRAFFVWVSRGRPLVTLKVASTLDGFIADGRRRARRAPIWITGPQARAAAHELRAAHDAVLVGAGTVTADDPRLTVRVPKARAAIQPTRVVLDGRLRTSPRARLVRARDGRTVIIGAAGLPGTLARARALARAGVTVALLPGRRGRVPIARALDWLAAHDIQSVLVEGGAEVHGAFIDAGTVDRVAVFIAPRLLGSGVPVARGLARTMGSSLRLSPFVVRPVGDDLLLSADVLPVTPGHP